MECGGGSGGGSRATRHARDGSLSPAVHVHMSSLAIRAGEVVLGLLAHESVRHPSRLGAYLGQSILLRLLAAFVTDVPGTQLTNMRITVSQSDGYTNMILRARTAGIPIPPRIGIDTDRKVRIYGYHVTFAVRLLVFAWSVAVDRRLTMISTFRLCGEFADVLELELDRKPYAYNSIVSISGALLTSGQTENHEPAPRIPHFCVLRVHVRSARCCFRYARLIGGILSLTYLPGLLEPTRIVVQVRRVQSKISTYAC